MKYNNNFNPREIPASQNVDFNSFETDKILILELSNKIDNYIDQHYKNGFFTLKGKIACEQKNEVLTTFNDFCNSLINQTHFLSKQGFELANELKNKKNINFKSLVSDYISSQQFAWIIDTVNFAIDCAKNKSLNSVFDEETFNLACNNGVSAVKILADIQNISENELNQRLNAFYSDFCSNAVISLINSNSPYTFDFIDKYKHLIAGENLNKINTLLNDFKVKYLATQISDFFINNHYNYDLVCEKLKNTDNNLKNETAFIFKTKLNYKKKLEKDCLEKNTQNSWEKVKKACSQDINSAFNSIDYSLNQKSVSAQKNYILHFFSTGCIKTCNKTFKDLFVMAFENTGEFNKLDLNNFQDRLSNEDFQLFQKIKKYTDGNDFYYYKSDYNLVNKLFISASKSNKKTSSSQDENSEKYVTFVKIVIKSILDYKKAHKEYITPDDKMKIIQTLAENFV